MEEWMGTGAGRPRFFGPRGRAWSKMSLILTDLNFIWRKGCRKGIVSWAGWVGCTIRSRRLRGNLRLQCSQTVIFASSIHLASTDTTTVAVYMDVKMTVWEHWCRYYHSGIIRGGGVDTGCKWQFGRGPGPNLTSVSVLCMGQSKAHEKAEFLQVW